MYYIGVSAYYHEASVFLTDGKGVNCFLKEEYFTRIKGDKNFPKRCINFLIEKFNLNNDNIEYICFYEKPFKNWWEIFYYSIINPIKNRNLLISHLKNFNQSSIFFYSDINKIIEFPKKKILYAPHHLSHCLNGASFISEHDKYAYITFDGVGDGETISIFVIEKDLKIKKIFSKKYPHSLGLFYSTITDFLGFEINEGEFKVMSLSSYGEPVYEKEMKKIFDTNNFSLDMSYFNFHTNTNCSFSEKFCKVFGEPYLNINNENNFKKYSNIASSAQFILEQTAKNLLSKAKELSRKNKFVITGGVALNCKMIQSLSGIENVEEIIVPPSPGDSGSAIGASNFANLYKNKKLFKLNTIFLGPDKKFINQNVEVESYFRKITSDKNFIADAAKKLIDGEIITSYYNKTEIGPRSLGNTSIFCNAKNSAAVKKLNTKVKKREFYQPLAPIICIDDFDKYFQSNSNITLNLEWMGTLCKAKESAKKDYSSIIHVDGTCRTQIVKDKNSITYNLLEEIKKLGSDILVNTSFNISNDPVVFDLLDVYVNMKRMNIKYVLMENGLYETKEI